MKSKTKFLTVLSGTFMALGMLVGCGGNQPAPTKYQVSYEKDNAYYTVAGIDSAGYVENATVTFTVTDKLPDQKTVSEVKMDTTPLTKGEGNSYTFTMPAKNVTINVTTVTVDHYTLSYTGTAEVSESITFALTNNGDPVSVFSLQGKTTEDDEFFDLNGKVATLKKEGTFTMQAKVDDTIVDEKEITVKADTFQTLDALMDSTTIKNLKSGKSTSSKQKYGGQVVAIGSLYSKMDVIIADGNTFFDVIAKTGTKEPGGIAVGSNIEITSNVKNDYGVRKSVEIEWGESALPSCAKISSRTFNPSTTATVWDATAFNNYVDTVVAGGATDATTVVPVQYVEFNATWYHPESGSDRFSIAGAKDGWLISASKSRIDLTELDYGTLYTVKGYVLGGNGSSKYVNFLATECDVAKVTEWAFDNDSVQGFVGAETDVPYTVTAPVGATGKEISYSIAPEGVATYDVTTHKLTGVAAGTAVLTLTIDGVEDTIDVTVSSEPDPCTGLSLAESSKIVNKFTSSEVGYTITSAQGHCTDSISIVSGYDTAVVTASLDKANNKLCIEPVAVGSTTVQIKCGDQTADLAVTVREQVIADLATAKADDEVDICGYVTEKYFNGFFLGDGANGMFIYTANEPTDISKNDIYRVKGAVAFNKQAIQVVPTAETGLEKLTEAPAYISTPSVTPLTKTLIEGFGQGDVGKHYSFTGVVKSVSGTTSMTYIITVDGKDLTVYAHSSFAGTADFKSKVKLGYTVTCDAFLTQYEKNYQMIAPNCSNAVKPEATSIDMESEFLAKPASTITIKASTLPVGSEGEIVFSIKEETDKVSVSGNQITVSDTAVAEVDQFTIVATCGTITKEATLKITNNVPQTVSASYPGGTTANMDGKNQASLFGVTEDAISIKGTKISGSNNVGLNKDGTIRLYKANSVELGISITDGTIISVKVILASSSPATTLVAKDSAGTEITGKNFVYSVNGSDIVFYNTHASSQVYIQTIEITYKLNAK